MKNEVTLTDGSLSLFTALAQDACNWSGTPGLDLNVSTNVADKGNLTDLKKKGLLTTSKSDGQTWVYFTAEGVALADSMGIYIDERSNPNPKDEAAALTVDGEVWKLRANDTTHNVRCASLVDGILMATPIRVKTGEPCGKVRQYNLTEWERVS